MRKAAMALAIVGSALSPAFAHHVVQVPATPKEATAIAAALKVIGCEVRQGEPIEREQSGVFEVDDAVCTYGQFDIKLNASYALIAMTYDGPMDAAGVEETAASPAEVEAIVAALAPLGCTIDPTERIEKETGTIFELDDIDCAGGQFDIKLNAQFTLLSLTAD